jgi:drug/metabolite transporter (DMT)-like permease
MRFVFSLIAALAWGLQYVLLEKLLIKLPSTIFFTLASTASFLFWRAMFFIQKAPLSLRQHFKESNTIRLLVLTVVLFLIGNIVIVFAIKGKNATVASLIEISYPLFVVLF